MTELISYVSATIYYHLPDNTTQSVIREGVCEYYEELGYYQYTLTEEDIAEIEVLGYNFVNWNTDPQMTEEASAGQIMTMKSFILHLYGAYTPFSVNDYITALADEARLFFGTEDKLSLKGILEKCKETNSFMDALISNNLSNPIHYKNNRITAIRANGFRGLSVLASIDLPKCTTIGDYAFNSCNNLPSIDLPECIRIGDYAFESCNNLSSINLPECMAIGNDSFAYCKAIASIDLPKCITIGESAFYGCNNITSIDLPKCTTIGKSAFYGCHGLTTIELPECIQLNNNSFGWCSNLTAIKLPKCTSLEYGTFESSRNLTAIYLSNPDTICFLRQDSTTLGLFYLTNYYEFSIGTKARIYIPWNLVEEYKSDPVWKLKADFFQPDPNFDIPTLEFTINGITYQSPTNMTWMNLIHSDYNVLNLTTNTDTYYVKNPAGENLYTSNGDYVYANNNITSGAYVFQAADDREPT